MASQEPTGIQGKASSVASRPECDVYTIPMCVTLAMGRCNVEEDSSAAGRQALVTGQLTDEMPMPYVYSSALLGAFTGRCIPHVNLHANAYPASNDEATGLC